MALGRNAVKVVTVRKLLLSVGVVCLALAVWSFLHGEVGDAILGLSLGILLLAYWRWAR
jgi:hypothetical protein